MRSMDGVVEELLSHFPPENIVDQSDRDGVALEAHGGCQTCAGGNPCQERIRTDIDDILSEAGLDATETLTCLQWLMREEYSSLTQSVTQMADDFRDHLATAASNTEHSFKDREEDCYHDKARALERS